MASERGPDQIRAELVATMGDPLGSVFFALWNDCVEVHLKWADFMALYGSSQERVNILFEAAPTFSGHLQGRMWDEILLHLSRLTGPSRTYGKWDNLTVRLLLDLASPAIRDEMQALVDVAISRAEFTKSWRNQRIAHTDLQRALNDPAARPLQRATPNQVAETLAAIRAVLNRVEDYYGKGITQFESPLAVGTVEDLVRVLQDGLEARCR